MHFLDVETRSSVNLGLYGARRYVDSYDFDVILMKLYNAETQKFETYINLDCVEILENTTEYDIIEAQNTVFFNTLRFVRQLVAHNASFEYTVLKKILGDKWWDEWWAKVNWYCTMSMCFAAGIPAKLADAARVLQVEHQKIEEGKEFINKYCIPNKQKQFTRVTQEDLAGFEKYCEYDNLAALDILNALPVIRDNPDYLVQTYEMNARGFPVDIKTAEKVCSTLNAVSFDDVPINPKSPKQIIEFCNSHGVEIDNARAQTVTMLLNDPDLPEPVRHVLLARAESSQSSTAKYQKILDAAFSIGNRATIKDSLQYYGAHTGRDSGRGVQPQNFPRGDELSAAMLPYIDQSWMLELYGMNPMETAKNAIRSIIKTENQFFCADFSNIETRCLFYLSGDIETLDKIRSGLDLYTDFAANKLFNCAYEHVDKTQRYIAKRAVLGLGFGAGVKGLASGFDQDGFENYDDDLLEVVVKIYRQTFSTVTRMWYGMQKLFIQALDNPDEYFYYADAKDTSKCAFCYHKEKEFLTITLPSNRNLLYFMPRYDKEFKDLMYLARSEGLHRNLKSGSKSVKVHGQYMFYVKNLYGGRIAQNCVQAIARDVMMHSFDTLCKNNYSPVLRCHDEILAEKMCSTQSLDEFKRLILECPEWGQEIPLAVDGWEGNYYRK